MSTKNGFQTRSDSHSLGSRCLDCGRPRTEHVWFRLWLRTGSREQVRFSDSAVGGDYDRGLQIPLGHNLKQRRGSFGWQREIAQLIYHQKCWAGEEPHGGGPASLDGGAVAACGQVGCGGEVGAIPGMGCSPCQSDRQVCLARAACYRGFGRRMAVFSQFRTLLRSMQRLARGGCRGGPVRAVGRGSRRVPARGHRAVLAAAGGAVS